MTPMKRFLRSFAGIAFAFPGLLRAQVQTNPPVAPASPPATKLEAFNPGAGSIFTLGFTVVGRVGGVTVESREMSDSKSSGVIKGLRVQVYESQYRREASFIDIDEVPELLKAFDALVAVKTNPTSQQDFEVRFTTKGGLQLIVYSSTPGKTSYVVRAGQPISASESLTEADFLKLKGLLAAASERLGGK